MKSSSIALTMIAMLMALTVSANAVDLVDCSKGGTKVRLACLQKNVILLNSSYQTVTAELRSEVADLKKQIAGIQIPPPPPPPNLSGFVRYGSKIRLRSNAWGGTCLDHDTKDAGHIQGWSCNDSGAQDWTVDQR